MKRRPELLNGVPVPYGAPTDELIQQAKGEAPACWAAFLALASDLSSRASEALREAMRSDDPYVRRAAIEAVAARPPDPDHASLIVEALEDPDGRVVHAACDAAATLGIREAHDRVVRLVTSADASTREVAVRALLALWHPADFTAVFDVFRKDRSLRVRKHAAWTLRKYVSEETWQPLFDAWSRDPLHRHRLWACEIAAEFGGPGVREQLSLLRNDQDGLVRRAATKALSAIGAA
jgi:HEAT repeat protein